MAENERGGVMITPKKDNLEEMKTRNQLLTQRPSEDCGCPEEEWIMNSLFIIIHLEDDGTGHVFMDCGDWDSDQFFEVDNMSDLRIKAEEWANSFKHITEY